MNSDRFKPGIGNKFSEGEIVYAKEHPAVSLIIRRYVHRIYYCRIIDDPQGDELVYFERELMESLKKV
jgi:hypothetical protein